MSSSPNPPTAPAPFSEKGFYLEEFHGKTLAVAAPATELRQPGKLVEVMEELARNEINVILISTERSALEPLVGENVLSMATPRLEGTVWRKLHDESRLGLVVGGSLAFAPACREAAVRLGIAKLVWIDRDGGLLRENRERISFVHLDELREILGSGAPANQRRSALLREVEAMLVADRKHGCVRLAVAGGSAVRALGTARKALPIEVWTRTKLTWVDERCVPFASVDSNRGEAHRSGALTDATPPAIELPLTVDGESVAQSLARVHGALREVFGGALDVTLLGMGPDGHIASLFPGHPALVDAPREALALHVADAPKPPLTRALLATATTHILLAVGEGKRDALERVIDRDRTLPAVGLHGLVIVTDVNLRERGT